MREAALQKRKKAAEELLQWHQRLLEEERKIAELEMTANTIIKQVPAHAADASCKFKDEKYSFKGSQLNLIWSNMTGRNQRKFEDEETYSLSKIALEKFCKDAKKNSNENRRALQKDKNISNINNKKLDETSSINRIYSDSESKDNDSIKSEINNSSISNSIKTEYRKSSASVLKFARSIDNTEEYSTEFDSPEIIEEHIDINSNKSNSSPHTEILVNEIDKSKSTLNEIMQNISNITDEISAIYKLSSAANTVKEESDLQSAKTCNDNTVSIIKETSSNYREENRKTETDNTDTSNKDESENETSSSNIQFEIVKSLTELISSQNACQDSKSEQKHNIIETPEPVCSKNNSTDSQGTSPSNIELYSSSNEIKSELTSVKDNEEDEINLNINLNNTSDLDDEPQEDFTENILHNSKSEIISINKNSGDVIEDLQLESNNSVMSVKCSVNNNSNIANSSIVSYEISQSQYSGNLSNSAAQNTLDLSYGFVGLRTKNADILSVTEISEEQDKTTATSALPVENGFDASNINHSDISKKINTENAIMNFTDDKITENVIEDNQNVITKSEICDNVCTDETKKVSIISNVELTNIKNIDSESENHSEANEETTISTESNFRESYNIDEINNENEIDCSENNLDKSDQAKENSGIQQLSSQINSSDSITSKNNIGVYENSSKTISEKELNSNKVVKNIIETTNIQSDSTEININEIKKEELDLNSNEDMVITQAVSLNEQDDIIDTIEDVDGKSIEEDSVSSEDKYDELQVIEEQNNDKLSQIIKDNSDNTLDVKKRVSEILADTTSVREDKSPRLQDIYTTTYDISSPDHSPETGSPVNSEKDIVAVTHLFDEEAEALFKKQLAIEQEIKQLEQQQKEQIPYMYMREIPNKPPPPYTPPVHQVPVANALPATAEQLNSLVVNISDKLYAAYEKGNIQDIGTNNLDVKCLNKINVDKDCYDFVFDLCKELAVEHYKQFIDATGPSWMVVDKKLVTKRKPFAKKELKDYLFGKVKELLGYEKVICKESMTSKWSRKKRDHVDELLVIESQTEESEWTNYDDDEIIVKNELTNDIMNMLISETAQVISKIFTKKMNLS